MVYKDIDTVSCTFNNDKWIVAPRHSNVMSVNMPGHLESGVTLFTDMKSIKPVAILAMLHYSKPQDMYRAKLKTDLLITVQEMQQIQRTPSMPNFKTLDVVITQTNTWNYDKINIGTTEFTACP
jgi:thioredoxin-related protein